MFEDFEAHKRLITAYLDRELGAAADPLTGVNRFGAEARSLLLEFTRRGKMIRGGLVALGYGLFRDDESEEATACGAALELLQSAILIHDDIMDRDLVRRGEKTLTAGYIETARAAGFADSDRTGEALGICLGDIGFFLAFRILSGIATPGPVAARLVTLFAREMAFVGAAQMLDVWSGAERLAARAMAEDEIISLYRYKTGRYTFALPLAAGALLAGREEMIPALELIGEDLGVAFQLKDDELDLFGEEREIGKPVGSDLREGKHTLLFDRLLARLHGAEKKRFLDLWGNADLSPAGVEEARRLVRDNGVLASVEETLNGLADRCRANIDALSLERPEKKDTFFRLLDSSLNRMR
ncbi:MAG: polyprenyl synthetase family protein [Spirochaetales bacterium]|nr:polyprenyl synthetase family protein [Spirochaetales bacterium]